MDCLGCLTPDCIGPVVQQCGYSILGGIIAFPGHIASSVALRAVGSVCGSCSSCWSTGFELGRAPRQEHEKPIEVLVRGDDIMEELRDLEVDSKDVVDKSTRNVKDFMKKCPVFIFGPARQGKSTAINDLLEELGDMSRPAKESFLSACTRGVDVYRCKVDSWTTPGVEEEVLLLDTEGWEFGRRPRDIFRTCMALAKSEHIQEKVLSQRLVLVCVLSAENRSYVEDPKFLRLLRDVCKQAASAASGGRPVLLPVVSKHDLLDSDHDGERIRDVFTKNLEKEVGCMVDVRKALSTTHKQEDGQRFSIQSLKKELADICTEQLRSEHILKAATDIIDGDLKRVLMEWDEEGIDASHALVRRFLWITARHNGLRIANLHKFAPQLGWNRTAKIVSQMKKWSTPKGGLDASDEWHCDPRRKRDLPHSRRISTSTISSISRSTPATSSGDFSVVGVSAGADPAGLLIQEASAMAIATVASSSISKSTPATCSGDFDVVGLSALADPVGLRISEASTMATATVASSSIAGSTPATSSSGDADDSGGE